MVATKPFPKGVTLIEGLDAAPVRESLAKGERLLLLQRVANRSPGVRRALREVARIAPEVASGLGLQHVELAEAAPARPVRRGFLGMTSDQIYTAMRGEPGQVATIETAPRPAAKPAPARKGYLKMSSDEIWEKLNVGW